LGVITRPAKGNKARQGDIVEGVEQEGHFRSRYGPVLGELVPAVLTEEDKKQKEGKGKVR